MPAKIKGIRLPILVLHLSLIPPNRGNRNSARILSAAIMRPVSAGCRELLDMLQARGVKLAIVTGRSETTCKISMEYLDLQKYFSVYYTGSPERNDKSAQLLKLMNDNNLQRDEIVYIGDAVSDVEACQKIDIKCLAAAWAKSARLSQLEAINPGLVFRTVEDMQEYMKKL